MSPTDANFVPKVRTGTLLVVRVPSNLVLVKKDTMQVLYSTNVVKEIEVRSLLAATCLGHSFVAV